MLRLGLYNMNGGGGGGGGGRSQLLSGGGGRVNGGDRVSRRNIAYIYNKV
jgi:hypothetical protein